MNSTDFGDTPDTPHSTAATLLPHDSWAAVAQDEPRNLLALEGQQVVHRVAWIFKTESVIIPAFLDAVTPEGSLRGLLRGCLPVLARFGHSVPPLLFAERLRRQPRKKSALVVSSLLMAIPFVALSAMWLATEDKIQPWFPLAFLGLYAAFFAVVGVNQLCFGTLQGKLIRPERRGRLLAVSGLVGSVCSIACAWFLLERWLTIPDNEPGRIGGFGRIFGFAGWMFAAAGLIVLFVREPADQPDESPGGHGGNHFAAAWRILRTDADFRRLAVVSMLFVTMQFLFPHFQALGREPSSGEVEAAGFRLMLWVVVQNAGTGVFSFVLGPVADRFGYRLTLRIAMFAAATVPLLALGLASGPSGTGAGLYWVPYFLLGLIPVSMRALSNYTLEMCSMEQHPHYLSTLKLCMAVPFVLAPLVGLLIDLAGFAPVFAGTSAVVAAGGLLTFRLKEPRDELGA